MRSIGKFEQRKPIFNFVKWIVHPFFFKFLGYTTDFDPLTMKWYVTIKRKREKSRKAEKIVVYDWFLKNQPHPIVAGMARYCKVKIADL